MSRRIQAAAAVLCVAALLSFAVRVSPRVYWPIAILVAVGAAVLVSDGGKGSSWSSGAGRGEFLCDSCKYDNERDCSRPERPNATRCPDYRRRGS